MKRFTLAAALLLSAIAAEGEIAFGPARALTAQPAIGPVMGSAERPAAASMGDQFLVGWNDGRGGRSFAPRVARLSASGELLDPTGIAFPPGSGQLLGLGSSGREYLAVTPRGLFIVTRDGEVTRGDPWIVEAYPFRVISNGIDYIVGSPAVSFRVDRTGKVLGQVKQSVRVAVGTSYVGTDGDAIVVLAPDGTIGRFPGPPGNVLEMAAGDGEIAVLSSNDGTQSITRFRLNGAQIGAAIPIVPPPSVWLQNRYPALGWDGTSYAVFYGALNYERPMAGVERGGVIALERLAFDATSPLLASSPHGALAVWEDARFKRRGDWGALQIAAMLLRHDSSVTAARDVIVSRSEHAQTSPRIATVGGRQLAAFIEASGEGEEIVVVPASGGGEMLRFPGEDHLFGLRAATNGEELFLLWGEFDWYRENAYDILWHIAIVTPALRATRFDAGTLDALTDLDVFWNGSEYVVYGNGVGFRFAPGGAPLQPGYFYTVPSSFTPSGVFADGQNFIAYSILRSSNISAGPVGWYDAYVGTSSFWYGSFVALDTNTLGTWPAIAAAGGKVVVATQLRAFTVSAAESSPHIRITRVAENLWSTLTPHVVARGGAFLVTAGGTLARIGDGGIGDVTRLPESAGVTLGFNDFDRVPESVVPAAGPLTLAYVAPGNDGPPRIWLRDLTLPERHRATVR